MGKWKVPRVRYMTDLLLIIIKTWIFLLFFGGNRVQLFFLAMSTKMFDVDRNSVKYAIHTNNHTHSTNYVLVKYRTNYRCLWTGPKLAVILTYWVVISRPSFASQNRAAKVLGREFALHKPP